MYEEISKIQKKLWQHDDLMEQNTLFELQDYVCKLLLKVAEEEKKTNKLIKDFFFHKNSYIWIIFYSTLIKLI